MILSSILVNGQQLSGDCLPKPFVSLQLGWSWLTGIELRSELQQCKYPVVLTSHVTHLVTCPSLIMHGLHFLLGVSLTGYLDNDVIFTSPVLLITGY